MGTENCESPHQKFREKKNLQKRVRLHKNWQKLVNSTVSDVENPLQMGPYFYENYEENIWKKKIKNI